MNNNFEVNFIIWHIYFNVIYTWKLHKITLLWVVSCVMLAVMLPKWLLC